MSVEATYKLVPHLVPGFSVPREQPENLGYGTDLSCDTDFPEDFAFVDPFSTQALAEAIIRRLDTPRGIIADDQDYGKDVRGMLNRPTTAADVQAMAGEIKSELEKDDRLDSVRVTVKPSPLADELTVEIEATPVDADAGGFALVLRATDADLLVEEIRAAS